MIRNRYLPKYETVNDVCRSVSKGTTEETLLLIRHKISPIVKLSEGEPGKSYRVLRILGRGMVKRRIMDMGLVPGARLRILGEAPLGDPMDVELNGTFLSIRKKEASLIEVEEL